MTNRITDKDLDRLCKAINLATKSPLEPYGPNGANVGNYHIDGAYGGVKLHRIDNSEGGVTDVLHCGYTTKRNLYNLMSAFLAGIRS